MEICTLPVYKNGPIGKFYKKIDFKNCYQNWDLVIIDTIGDGSCLFHAICNSFFVPYYTEILNGEKIQRRDLVRQMRKEFAEKLSSPISLEANSLKALTLAMSVKESVRANTFSRSNSLFNNVIV